MFLFVFKSQTFVFQETNPIIKSIYARSFVIPISKKKKKSSLNNATCLQQKTTQPGSSAPKYTPTVCCIYEACVYVWVFYVYKSKPTLLKTQNPNISLNSIMPSAYLQGVQQTHSHQPYTHNIPKNKIKNKHTQMYICMYIYNRKTFFNKRLVCNKVVGRIYYSIIYTRFIEHHIE